MYLLTLRRRASSSMLTWGAFALSAVASIAAEPAANRAAEGKHVIVRNDSTMHRIEPGYKVTFAGLRNSSEGPRAVGLVSGPDADNELLPSRRDGDYLVRYPDLEKGRILPIFGGIYRVNSFSESELVLEEVPKHEGIRVSSNSYVVPLHGEGQLYEQRFRVEEFVSRESGSVIPKSARLRIWHGGSESVVEVFVSDYGDPTSFDHLLPHHVRRLVGADKKRGIIGWIEVDPKKTRETAIVFNAHPSRDILSYQASFSGMEVRGTTHFAKRLHVFPGPKNTTLTQLKGDIEDFSVDFPDLHVGDIIPVFGSVYRVRGFDNSALVLEKLHTDEIPKLISVSSDSFAIPLLGWGQLHGWRVKLDALSAVTSDMVPGVARLELWFQGEKKKTTEVKVGELLQIDGKAHKVRRTIARNRAEGVVGWIELDPMLHQ